MEELYCDKCKDYTPHLKDDELTECSLCNNVYDYNRKRYIITGPSDDPVVIKVTKELLEKEPDSIIISEDVALSHKLKGLSSRPNFYQPEPFLIESLPEIEDLRYSHLSKKEREADIQPVRTEPKIQRNDPCPCGSGKKYKKCCGK